MSEVLTTVVEKNAAPSSELEFTPPPALIAALSAAWAAYDAAKAANLPQKTIDYFDEGIDLVLDEIDMLKIEVLREAGELDPALCKPATEFFAEIGNDNGP